MNRKLLIIFTCSLLLLILISLTGCSYNVSNEEYSVNGEIFGTIIDKFMAPHQDIVEHKYINGKDTIIEKHTVDRYYFEIKRMDDNDEYITDIEVPKEIFDQYGIGDFYGE